MVNWRSGDLTITLTVRDDTAYNLKTVQSIDPAPVDSIEVMDSLTQQRLGYQFNPRRLRLTMVVLPSSYTIASGGIFSDAALLTTLAMKLYGANYLDGIFDLTIDDAHDGIKYQLNTCAVASGSPGTIAMDAIPATQFVVEVLDPRIVDNLDVKQFQDFDGGLSIANDTRHAVFP